jgi:hypothetical protein
MYFKYSNKDAVGPFEDKLEGYYLPAGQRNRLFY